MKWLIALFAALFLVGVGVPGTAAAKSKKETAGAHAKPHKKVKKAPPPDEAVAGDEPQESSGGGGAGGVVVGLLLLGLGVATLASYWKLFALAGKPGWASLVPIYNFVVIMQIAGKPLWQIVLLFVPVANLFVTITALMGFTKAYGKGTGFAIGAALVPFVFLPLLAFGGTAVYVGPQAPTPQGGAPQPQGPGASGFRKAA